MVRLSILDEEPRQPATPLEGHERAPGEPSIALSDSSDPFPTAEPRRVPRRTSTRARRRQDGLPAGSQSAIELTLSTDPSHPPPPPSQIDAELSIGVDSTGARKPMPPYFCYTACLVCAIVFVLEVNENGWRFQPLTCEATCDGRQCNKDGTACEPNLMFGPTIAVLDQLGAKNEEAIFDRGEWWRILACNWLHAGLFHLLFNIMAIRQIGFDLEKVFGFWRVGLLYILAGIFGTILSIVFLPSVLSVGASASVFGLLGAVWADIIVNYCARGSLKGSAICGVSVCTALNVVIGLTPWVDNFMHLGGMIAGLLIGLTLFAKEHDTRTGRQSRTKNQEAIVLISVVIVLSLAGVAAAVIASPTLRNTFRSCPFCEHINCVPLDWWSCCVTRTVGGTCLLQGGPSANGTISALCNMTGTPPYVATCSPSANPDCVYAPEDADLLQGLCSTLCSGSC